MSVLDKLRSPLYTPSISHIRQLIFISLYPQQTHPKGQSKLYESSPRKSNPHRALQQRMKPPNQDEKSMALALLNAFLLTNSPGGLFRDLPSCIKEDSATAPITAAHVDPADDSPIGKEAKIVGHARDCWALLAQDFIDTYDGEGDDLDGDMDSTPLIGPHSWSTLSWIVGVFERDEQLSFHHSMLLLSQIPKPARGLAWDATIPINIVFESCKQTSNLELSPSERGAIGIRLLQCLVELTMRTPVLSSSHLLRLTSERLPELPVSVFRHLLSSILPEHAAFKFGLTCLYLANYSQGGSSDGFSGGSPSKKQPTSRAKQRSLVSNTSTVSTTPYPAPYPIPPVANVMDVLALAPKRLSSTSDTIPPSRYATPPPTSAPQSSQSTDVMLRHALAKFHLICALGTLKIPLGVEEWRSAVETGKLRRVVCASFDVYGSVIKEDTRGMHAAVELLMDQWERL